MPGGSGPGGKLFGISGLLSVLEEAYGVVAEMGMPPCGLVMLWTAVDKAVVFMRLSSAGDSKLRSGAAFVNAQNPKSNARRNFLGSVIVVELEYSAKG